jgi:ATP-dependent DNA ligase
MTIPRVDGRAFPKLPLPLPIPYPPMEARRVETLPEGDDWQFEPKWDGFRCLAFRWKDEVALQSKAGQPLTRYFPELVAAFRQLPPQAFVLDGEIVVPVDGTPSFDDLLLRIHPAASRIAKLAQETPAKFFAFDLLYDSVAKGRLLVDTPLTMRRERLERFFQDVPRESLIELSPATRDPVLASSWFTNMGPLGLDGVMAKKIHERYHSGDREAMMKIKHLKTADCIVGGFRYSAGKVGSLLLGLYDESGLLHFVGHTSSFSQPQRTELRKTLEPLTGGVSFTGRTPGGPSRWSAKRNMEWEPVKPVLVCEVRYDYFAQHRFRHGTSFLRWRPEKDPKSCTMDQVAPPRPRESFARISR